MDHADGALAATTDAPGIARTRAVVASAVTLLDTLDKDRQTKIRFLFMREPIATAAHSKGGMRGDVDIVDHPVSTLTLGPRRGAETIAPQGLPASAMDHRQRDMLFDLVLEWAGILNDDHAAPRLPEIMAGLEGTSNSRPRSPAET